MSSSASSFEQCVLDSIAHALWDPQPTRTDLRARQLATALGYPPGWRVVRTLEKAVRRATNPPTKPQPKPKQECEKDSGEPEKQEERTAAATERGEPSASVVATATTAVNSEFTGGGYGEGKERNALTTAANNDEEKNPTPPAEEQSRPSTRPEPASALQQLDVIDKKGEEDEEPPPTPPNLVLAIVDRIYAGKPGSGCDMWFHHEAAMEAAAQWNPEESAPFDYGGGHLLARQPMFRTGDKVQVLYEGQWYDATVLRRRPDKKVVGGFLYGVHYAQDGTKQSGVDESLIRHRPEALDSKLAASKLGMKGWDAYLSGGNRYKVVDPSTGKVYWSKKQALEAYTLQYPPTQQQSPGKDSSVLGDPPWRTAGSEYVGRHVLHTFEHRASARRTVTIEQYGTVVGWISETDVDRSGAPGFVSEKTGRPARLFHVRFAEVPHHPYASLLLVSVDMEEDELERCVLPPEEEGPAKKKAKLS
jgi:hypothetical protein